ncbi:MAG TPA: hypothetical protein V6C89_09730 [Drouetiella sp.]
MVLHGLVFFCDDDDDDDDDVVVVVVVVVVVAVEWKWNPFRTAITGMESSS